MFGNIQDYVTDGIIELKGVDLSFGKGRFITIARAGGSNQAFKFYSANKFKSHNKEMKRGELDEAVAEATMHDIYASKVVIGWKGWTGDNGKDIPFTVKNCIALFKASPEIYRIVYEESQNLDNFRKEEVAESGNE